ncbi:unnamed protein product [Closterium sp. NIES-54]
MCTYQQQQQLMYIHASPWIDISCDESTDWSRSKHLVVFAAFMKEQAVVTEFLALLTIHKCDAGSLFAVLLSHHDNIGIDLQRIVAVSTDGVGVMIGSHSGHVVHLRSPNFIASASLPVASARCRRPQMVVDITLVHQEVDRTIGAIRLRYMEYVDIFGEGVSKLLSPFIARLGSGRRTICVDGTDADGEPSSYQIVLSEAPIPGHQYGGSMTDCIKLCKAFALEVATNMHTRMWSLKQMEGSKLHKVETWLEASDKRERRVLSWLDASARLFNNRLPAACALPACTPHAPCPSALLRAAAAVTSAAATAACTAAAANALLPRAAATAACPTRNRAALPNALPARERASCPRAPLRPCPLALSASSLRPTVRCCCCHLCSPSCCMRCCCYLLMLLSTTVVAERAAAAIAAASVPAAAPELLLPNALLLLLLLQVVLLLRLRCCRYPRCLHAPSPRAAAAAAVRLLLRDAAAAATCCSCCSLLQLLLLAATCCSCHSLLLLLLAAAAPYCHCCYNSSCCCCCCYGYCSYG